MAKIKINSAVASGSIPPREIIGDEKKVNLKEVNPTRKIRSSSMVEDIAGDNLTYLNHYWPGCKEAFPSDQKLQTVHRYFPYAEGGPLYVDTPQQHEKLELYERKEKAMKERKLRYLLLKPDMTEMQAREALA